jgi:hypothetical protein
MMSGMIPSPMSGIVPPSPENVWQGLIGINERHTNHYIQSSNYLFGEAMILGPFRQSGSCWGAD